MILTVVAALCGCATGNGEPHADFMQLGPAHPATAGVQVFVTQAPQGPYQEIGIFSMTVWHTHGIESEYGWLREYCRRVGADGMILLPSDSTGYGKYHGRVIRVMAIKSL